MGYGGTYYAYLYSTALAAAMWRTHFVADPLSRMAGASGRLSWNSGTTCSRMHGLGS